jgi:hypothetical protein
MWKNNWNWLFLVSLFLPGCAVTTPISITTPVLPTNASTLSLSATITKTPLPVRTKEPTETITHDLTPTVTPVPTLSPLPTLPDYESAIKIEQLLLNNGDCRLPCFWGITPGKTSVAELYQFTNQFFPGIGFMEKSDKSYTLYYAHEESGDTTFTVEFFEEESIIKGIGIKLDTARLSFPLTRLLTEYNMPDKVLIGPVDSSYDMFVLYQDQRIVGQYHLFSEENGNYLCYDPKYVVGIVTWAKDKRWLDYVNQLFGFNTDEVSESSLKPLDQVTVYDMPTFYKQFSTRNRTICMKTLTNP